MITVYLVSAELQDTIVYKIGWTRRTPEDRMREFQTGNASNLTLIDTFESKWGTKVESSLKRRFKEKRISGEWFNLSVDDVSQFSQTCEHIHYTLKLLSEENSYIIERKLL